MRKGIAYGSNEGRAFTAAVTAVMQGEIAKTSAKLAKGTEPFVHYEFNKRPMAEVMKKHREAVEDIGVREDLYGKDFDLNSVSNLEELITEARNGLNEAISLGEQHGYRNAQFSVLAPTGTIVYLMHADTTGIEPDIALKIWKELAGSGGKLITIVNHEVPNALRNLGYSDNLEEILSYVEDNNTIVGAPHVTPNHYNVFDTAFGDGKKDGKNGISRGSIDFKDHVLMLGAAQPFISGAISKTCNLPEQSTVKDIYDSFLLGNKLGLKALAVFRDESKPTAALKMSNKGYKKLGRGEKEDLPHSGGCFRQEVKIAGYPFLIHVGEFEDGRPGEIVINSYSSGSEVGELLRIAGIGASKALKRGVELEDVVAGWAHRSNPSGMVTIDSPKGPHPDIKTALSPLDFVGKLLLLHYRGRTDIATEPEKVDITKLRGFNNGAFAANRKSEIDDWNFKEVIKNPELGGFEKRNGNDLLAGKVSENGKLDNARGVTCDVCKGFMIQTSPNCFECPSCGEKRGGCGL